MKDLLKNKKLITVGICVYLILIACLSCWYIPLNKSTWIAMDSTFHFSRLQGLSNYFKSPVNFNNFAHIGKMVNVFYPPITLLPLQVVQWITKNWLLTFNFSFYFYSIITSFVAFYSMKKYSKSDVKSLIFATLWTLSSTRVTRLTFFAALGNVAAMAFIPLVLLGAYYLFYGDFKKWYILVIGLLLIIYSHILTFMLVSILVAVIFVISLVHMSFDKNRYKYICVAAITFILGSVVVLLPIYEQTKAYQLFLPDINIHIGENTVVDIFFGALRNGNDLGIIWLILFVFVSIRFKVLSTFEKALYFGSIFFIILGSNLAPWKLLIHTPLANVQFTSRFQMFASVSILVIVANKFKEIFFIKNISDKKCLYFILPIVLISSFGTYIHEARLINHHLEKQVSGKDINGWKYPQHKYLNYWHRDYTNIGYTYGKYVSNKVRFSKWGIELMKNRRQFTIDSKIVKIKPEYDANNFMFKYNNKQSNTKLVVPISVYKGINIYVNNKKLQPKLSKYSTLLITLKDKGVNKVKIFYKYTLLARISQFVSLLTWVGMIIFINKDFIMKKFKK